MELIGIFLLALCRRRMERVSEWDWPARGTGPLSEAHMGKTRVGLDRDRWAA